MLENNASLEASFALNENTSNSSTGIIIFDDSQNSTDITLCIQALLANTDLTDSSIYLYTSKNKSDLNKIKWELFDSQNINICYNERRSLPQILADISSSSNFCSEIVLLSVRAIVASNWLTYLQQAAVLEDIGVVVSRQIRHRQNRNAWDLIPYAMDTNNIDVAISEKTNLILDPGFCEEKYLISLSKVSFFCLYFTQKILDKVNFSEFAHNNLEAWLQNISNAIVEQYQMHMVYTPESKVYHAENFY